MQREYSLWIAPKGKVLQQLEDLICTLANKYHSPKIPPHITLIGKLDINEKEARIKAKNLSDILTPYLIKLKTIESLKEYSYCCLFAKADKTKQVIEANKKAREIFQIRNNHYEPHLSLVYGFFPPEEKEKVIQEIGDFDYGFQVEEVSLFSTAGGIFNWYEVERFLLK